MSVVLTEGKGARHVVVVHGAGSAAKPMMRLASALLTRLPGTRVSVPDLTSHLGGRDAEPVQGYIQTVAELIDAETHLVGHSMGAKICAQVAINRQVRSLSLIEPMTWGILVGPENAAARQEDQDVFQRFDADRHNERGVASFIEYWNQSAWTDIPEVIRDRMIAASDQLYAEAKAVSHDNTGPEQYGSITAPTIAIAGSRTRPPAQKIVDEWAKLAPVVGTYRIEGARHMDVVSNPEPFADVIATHIKNH